MEGDIQSNQPRVTNRQMNNNPQRFISNEIEQLLIDLGLLHSPKKVLDFTFVDDGRLTPFVEKVDVIHGMPLDQTNEKRDLNRESSFELIKGDELTTNVTEKYDLIFCTPPVGERMRVNGLQIPIDLLYIQKALSLLDRNGTLLFLCSSAFLTGNQYVDIRNTILNDYYLKMIVTIPLSRLGNSGINVSLLVIQNSFTNSDHTVIMPEYRQNRHEILECFRNSSADIEVKKSRLAHRWDRHFFNPKYDKIQEILKDKQVCTLEEMGEVIHGHMLGLRKERLVENTY